MTGIARRPMMIVFSSPSGAGKTSITRRLLALDTDIRLSVSCTTRPMRPGEIEGQDYFFITPEAFDTRLKTGGFLEYAKAETHAFGHSYGTPRDYVDAAMQEGKDVLFDIEWQGARQLRAAASGDVVSIFVLPPSKAHLRERLARRAQDDEAVMARRMAKANDEISHWGEYDYVIVNDFLERALQEAREIIAAERLRRIRQPGLEAFVSRLMNEA